MSIALPDHGKLPAGMIPDVLNVERVLDELHAPMIFVTRSEQGQLLLAYVCDENSIGVFTLLTPVTERTVEEVAQGMTGVREALLGSCLWLHVAGQGTWAIEADWLPELHLPKAGARLFAEQEPVMRTRAVGETLTLGRMPASVVAFVAEATKQAMKTILDQMLAAPTEGRPSQQHRSLYDLPIQQFSFSSFELSFGAPPEPPELQEQVRVAARRLEQGLQWASGISQEILVEDASQKDAILRAALLLSPPSAGPIVEVQVSGSWLSHSTVTLTRESRKRLQKAIKAMDSEVVVAFEGRIGELDEDNLSCILRDTSDGQEHRGLFDDTLLDDMHSFFAEKTRVAVAGVEREGRLRLSAIAPAKTRLK